MIITHHINQLYFSNDNLIIQIDDMDYTFALDKISPKLKGASEVQQSL